MRIRRIFPWLVVALSALSALGAETATELKTQFVPQVSLMTPTELTLTDKGLEVYYAGENLGQPFLHLGWQRWLKNLGHVNFYGEYRIGYTFRQGNHQVLLMDSGIRDSDSVRLHWIPLSTGLHSELTIPGMSFLRPYFGIAAGINFLNQNSTIDGSQSFVLPFMSSGFGVSFINLESGEGDRILGFSFGVSYQNTFATSQPIRGWSFDFGFNLRM